MAGGSGGHPRAVDGETLEATRIVDARPDDGLAATLERLAAAVAG